MAILIYFVVAFLCAIVATVLSAHATSRNQEIEAGDVFAGFVIGILWPISVPFLVFCFLIEEGAEKLNGFIKSRKSN